MIRMTSGKNMRIEEASLKIYKEEKLCSGPCHMIDGEFVRDVIGVIENHSYVEGRGCCKREDTIVDDWFRITLHDECDTQPRGIGYKNDEESLRKRAKHMATYIFKWKWPTY